MSILQKNVQDLELTDQSLNSAPMNDKQPNTVHVKQMIRGTPVNCYVAGHISPSVETDSIAHALRQLIQGDNSSHLNTALELSAENLYPILSLKENRYLAREIDWQLSVDGGVAYQLKPDSESCLDELIASLKPQTDTSELHIVVGKLSEEVVGFQKPPKLLCQHTMLKTRNFLVAGVVEALKKYAPTDNCDETLLTEKVVTPILSHTHNLGVGDAERALNYACWNYPDIYAVAYKMLKGGFDNDSQDNQGFCLEDIFYEPYRLQGQQQIFQIVFEFRGNSSSLQSRWFCRVDVSMEYPTLQHGMQRYYG